MGLNQFDIFFADFMTVNTFSSLMIFHLFVFRLNEAEYSVPKQDTFLPVEQATKLFGYSHYRFHVLQIVIF